MLALYFRPSFRRSLKHLDPQQISTVGLILEALEIYYSANCNLEEAKKSAPRFFYKKLRSPYYEAGIESNLRVIIGREKEKCIAILAGNHDQILKFLLNV